jgi:hypothetical protein
MICRGARRKFLDVALIKHQRGYLEQLARYEKLLQERNELLKKEAINPIQLDVVTNQMIEASLPMSSGEAPNSNSETRSLTRSSKPCVQRNRGQNPLPNVCKPFPQFFRRRASCIPFADGDIKRKVTNVAPTAKTSASI